VTLRFLGDVDPHEVRDRLDATSLPTATGVVGPAVRRLGRRTLVVPVAGLDELAAAIGAATADIGEPPRPVPFTGHLTLARLRPGAAPALTGAPISAEFPVEEVTLVRSDLGSDSASYEVSARWATAR
jgi:2'-5' RNA ligase